MAINIGMYTFDGPFLNNDSLQDRSGIYAILCYVKGDYHVIDIGESATVKSRIETHDRRDCWENSCFTTLYYAALYTSNLQQSGRRRIESELRQQYNPVCGER
jgi:hypothetical protein